MRAPRQLATVPREARAGGDEVALQAHVQPGLFERLALGTRDELLPGLDAAAGPPPDVLGERGLADQRDPVVGIEDEQRHVVEPVRVVGRERELLWSPRPTTSSAGVP
jgi:hypothetical protein